MNLNAIDLRLMRSLIALSRSPSFVRAAQKLHISQPALSQQMAELSRAMGVPLFEKVGRRSVLTEAGRNFAHALAQSLGSLEDTLLEHSSARHEISGTLRVAATNTYLNALATPVSCALAKAHPGLKFHLRELPAHDILRCLEEGSVDLGISPRMGIRKTLHADHLFTESFGVIGPEQLVRPLGRSPTLAALAHTPMVLLTQDFLMRQQIDQQAKLDHVALNVRLEVSGAQNIVAALQCGDSLSIGSPLSVFQEPGLRFAPLRGRHLTREAVVYQRASTPTTRAITLFKSELSTYSRTLIKRFGPKRVGIA